MHTRQIAKQLRMSERAVSALLNRALQKLNAEEREAFVRLLVEFEADPIPAGRRCISVECNPQTWGSLRG